MKMKSKTLRTIVGIPLFLLWIVFSIFFFTKDKEMEFVEKIVVDFLYGCGCYAIYLTIHEIWIFPIERTEEVDKAWEELKRVHKDKIGINTEVYYLFPEDTSNQKYNELAYRAKYKGYIFLAKIMDDNKIYLSCVDDKGNEIEHREIENPFFFNKHFSFTKKE